MRWLARLLDFLLPELTMPQNDTAYRDALTFAANFQPAPGVDYTWVHDDAKATYNELAKTYDQLDAKADSLLKYIGIGTSLASFGSISQIGSNNARLLVWMLPTLFCACVSAYFALRARQTGNFPYPQPTDAMLTMIANSPPTTPRAWIGIRAALMHPVKVGASKMVDLRAAIVKRAVQFFAFAVIGLSLPILAALRYACP